MNLFRKDLKDGLRGALLWTVSLVILSVWMLDLFTSFQDSAGVLEFINQFPESFRKAFGIDRLNLATPEGYFGTEVHILILLFGSIYAVLLGSSILSKEEDGRTAEFLLSKPIARDRVVLSKISVCIVLILALNVFVWGSSYWAMNRYDTPYDTRAFWVLGAMSLGVHLTFSNLGFLGSVFVTGRRSVYGGSLGLVLGAYAVAVAGDLTANLRFLAHLSPMKWANAADILTLGTARPGHIFGLLATNVAAIALAFVFYRKKDILV